MVLLPNFSEISPRGGSAVTRDKSAHATGGSAIILPPMVDPHMSQAKPALCQSGSANVGGGVDSSP